VPRKRRRRRATGGSQAWEELALQDRFVLTFWHRYQAFVPHRGIAIRTEQQLGEKAAAIGKDLPELAGPDHDRVTARREKIRRWQKDGYLTRAGKLRARPDRVTRQAIEHPVDEIAIRRGCRFDPARALFAIEWMESFLVLYEGSCAGEPFSCRDWQDAVSRRMFGWVRWSEKWQRWVRRFRAAEVFIPKKNKKSPTLAAWSVYMMAGDGEPGQHVYLGAKDGLQAKKIAGKHAIEMVVQSALNEECKINQNEKEITHLPTRGTLLPLSSSNARTTQSKEGLNGSLFVDEIHVVDRNFMNRTNRMGISRPEPLKVGVSTAGNNPDGYGKERFDYALKVNACRDGFEDIYTLGAIYSAPQDLADEDLAADPAHWGRIANPAWGHTIDEDEFLADYQESRSTISKLLDFKMYRLNIWQRAANPWLKPDQWAACAKDYGPDNLLGRTCGGAWDLGRTKDMAALALAFPDKDAADQETRADVPHRCLLWYWMPEEALELYAEKVPMLREWAASGRIRVIEGGVIEFGQVEDETAEILERYDVQRFHYDPMFASASAQRLVTVHGYDERRIAEFPQTTKYYTWPINVLENLIVARKFGHPNCPVTNWQAGHVAVKDRDGKKVLTKPDGEDFQKIDGMVAIVMGLDASLKREDTKSVYRSRGLVSL
jgi:phage terminase large subunit-like protein